MKRTPFLGILASCVVSTVLFIPSGIGQKSPLSDSPYYVHILKNGSFNPASASFDRDWNIYTLTGDIYFAIIVERDNITIDGAGYSLIGNEGAGPGILWRVTFHYRHGVTVKNLVVKNKYIAFDLTYADENTLVGNTIINSGHAFYLWWSSTGKTTLTDLSVGQHSLIVYAKDNVENTGISKTVYFSAMKTAESIPITWIQLIVVAILVVGAILLICLKRLKHLGTSSSKVLCILYFIENKNSHCYDS